MQQKAPSNRSELCRKSVLSTWSILARRFLLLLAGDRRLEVQQLQLNFQEAGSRERLFALRKSLTAESFDSVR